MISTLDQKLITGVSVIQFVAGFQAFILLTHFGLTFLLFFVTFEASVTQVHNAEEARDTDDDVKVGVVSKVHVDERLLAGTGTWYLVCD